MQSPSAPQTLIPGHHGAQVGATHALATHRCDAQSPLAPHGLPSGHDCGPITHAGGWHVPFRHCCDAQSVLPPQALPSAQPGAHAGGAHLPETQLPEPQLEPSPHGLPSLQRFGPLAQLGGWHLPPAQLCEAQSMLESHSKPSSQRGAHATPLSPATSGLASTPASCAAIPSEPAPVSIGSPASVRASGAGSTPSSTAASPRGSAPPSVASSRVPVPTMSEQPVKSKPAQHVVTERKRDEPISTP